MARTIDWNKKAVKMLNKFIPEERQEHFEWYNDRENDDTYTLVWKNGNVVQMMVMDKKTLKVTFVN